MSELRSMPEQDHLGASGDKVELIPVAALNPYRWQRLLLFLVPPILIVGAAVYLYLNAGRHLETSNAYIKSDRVTVSAEVSGIVSSVSVADNQSVSEGAVLFEINSALYRIQARQKEAALAQVLTDLAANKVEYTAALAETNLHRSNVAFAQSKLVRQQELQRKNMGTTEDLEFALHDLETAQNQVALAGQKATRLLATLGGDADISEQYYPPYLAALAAREEAALYVERTSVRAPFDGIATNVPKPGDYVSPGRAVMAVVSDTGMWVEANFKETKMTYIRVGQDATVKVDTYPGYVWHGRVQSISEATGAEFAILPPQNATGNWIKIVQRIPVKITFDAPANAPPLRLGMSATVAVDTLINRTWKDLLPEL